MSGSAPSSRAVSFRAFDPKQDWGEFEAVVSLHAHTHHSREVMADLPRYIIRIPIVAACFERELQTYVERTGCAIDFSKGWWHPPVGPREVFESEATQIEKRFGLGAFVSVTDHDSIAAGLHLQTIYAERRAPISFEWTVPYGNGFFHLGVHNLPSSSAAQWFARLAGFTGQPEKEPLAGILADLHDQPDVLLVFNHPWWDLAGVGDHAHATTLARFIKAHRSVLHALELNGYRSRKENDRVRLLAATSWLPLVSGGDRHGRTPNALLNVTAAQSFAGFVEEIRSGVSHIVVMPEYRQHLVARKLATASDVLRSYRWYPAGRRHWTDRISYISEGGVRPLSFLWRDGGPLWARSSILAFQVLTSPVVLRIIRMALETVDPAAVKDRLPVTEEIAA